MTLTESDIIRRFFSRPVKRSDVMIGIGDDAAVIQPPPGMDIVTAIDTIVEGVHFPPNSDAADIGYRVLAVNLSDLAAMSAQPAWGLLSLSLPSLDEGWLQSFSDGFFELASSANVTLAGGDLVRGPLAATISLSGYVAHGTATTRSGAQPGDPLFVTGCPGAASRGLASLLAGDERDAEAERCFRHPIPRIEVGLALRGLATSMIDISDGLLKDATHIATESGVKIVLDYEALQQASNYNVDAALTGGDDYELLLTIAADNEKKLRTIAAEQDCRITCIGRVQGGSGLVMPGHDLSSAIGFDHFQNGAKLP